jgi:uncharacterized protein YjbI with pentapeptide repeats
LASGADLEGAELERADVERADLGCTDLRCADRDFGLELDLAADLAGAFLDFDFALAMPSFYRLPVAMGRRD